MARVKFGNSGTSAVAYVAYGIILATVIGDIDRSYAFGQLALRALEQYKVKEHFARTHVSWHALIRIWKEHVRESYRDLPNGYRLGLEVGDLEFAGWGLIFTAPQGLFLGVELSELDRNTGGWIVAAGQIKQETACRYMRIQQQAIQNLRGLSEDPCLLSGAVYDEKKMLPVHFQARDGTALATVLLYKLQLAYLMGCHEAAREHADALRGYLSSLSSVRTPTFYLFNALTWLALFPKTTGEDRDRATNAITESLSRFEKWAAHAPMNFAAKLALIQAEHQRVLGQPELARAAYYRAIALAREHEYRNDEALATELFAAFLRGQQEHEVSRLFLAKARHLYHLWGAEAKVRDIERKFPEIVAMTSAMGKAAEPSSPSTIVTDTRASNSLDLLSAIKASQAISGEVVLHKLLEKLIEIVIENAGARSGLLIMEGDTHLVAEAQRSAQGTMCEVKLYDHLEMVRLDYSPEIVRYVQRTHQAVVLGDASTSAYFKDHSQNSAYRPKSVLCMPILLQKRLVGVLYLENELISNAFTEDRCKILELLASQAAISLDNAKLYQTLEHKVEQRTRLLQEKNEELSRTLVELRKTQNQLVQSEKMASMGRLTMGIAHELKNPLNFIINFAKIEDSLVSEIDEELEDVRDALPPDTGMIDAVQDLKRAAAGIHEHGVRANDIIQSMMRHAAGVSGERTAFRIGKLLDQAIKLVLESPRVVDSNAKINIECDFDSTVGEVLIVAQEMLCVCINLLENAVDAVLAKKRVNGPAYVPTVRVDARRESNAVRIRVHDNGPGIAPSTLSRIFEPFFTTKAPGTGIGLGLSLSYDIVVQGHQGTIECESVEGEGSTFIIRLPT
ncbi:MAG TPA: ATP-binding protein [Polyangium sp.]|nr:ATP-binding protein [Polyangium sp.]